MIAVAAPDAALCARLAELMAEAYAAEAPAPWSAAAIGAVAAMPGAVLLVDDADAPGGFALGRLAADEGEILALAVRPALRRAGLGGRLLGALEAALAAAGAVRLFLEVAECAGPARALYRRAGWAEAGRRPRYHPARRPGAVPQDALLLARTL